MPPKKKQIDYDTLKRLCHIHCTGEECAAILEIDYDTLNNRLKDDGNGGFSEYFKKHSASGKASLRRRQFKTAEDGNVTMQIWLGKQYLGQADKVENTGDEHKPINIHIVAPDFDDSQD